MKWKPNQELRKVALLLYERLDTFSALASAKSKTMVHFDVGQRMGRIKEAELGGESSCKMFYKSRSIPTSAYRPTTLLTIIKTLKNKKVKMSYHCNSRVVKICLQRKRMDVDYTCTPQLTLL
jgi:hypothetical protein